MNDDLIRWIRDTPLGHFMRETDNAFPVAEMSHFIGLSLLMGVMVVVDLRVLGVFRQTSYSSVLKLLPLAILGFAINLISGVCFIATNPFLYFTNPAFFWKLGFILLGGLNALWFTFAEYRQVAGLPTDAVAPMPARIMAATSLGMWTLVLLLGRLLPTFAPVAGG
jgi:hypothetical protein